MGLAHQSGPLAVPGFTDLAGMKVLTERAIPAGVSGVYAAAVDATVGRASFTPVVIEARLTFDRIGYDVAVAAAVVAAWGLYRLSDDGLSLDRVFNHTADVTGATPQNDTVAKTVIEPGIYWVASTINSVTASVVRHVMNSVVQTFNQDLAGVTGSDYVSYLITGQAGVLASTYLISALTIGQGANPPVLVVGLNTDLNKPNSRF